MLFSIRTIIATSANDLLGWAPRFDCGAANGRYQRILPVRARSGGGRLNERTLAVQPRLRERVKVPRSRPLPGRNDSLEAAIRGSGGYSVRGIGQIAKLGLEEIKID